MAKVEAKVAFDMRVSGDLNFGGSGKIKSTTQSKTLIKATYENGESDAFKGSFGINYSTKRVTGTATQWIHAKGTAVHWQLTALSLSAPAVETAIRTASKADDAAVVTKMLAKGDTIIGSKYADYLMGYGGNDTIQGNGGIDTINGGDGTDRALFTEKTVAVTLTLKGATGSYVFLNGVKADKIINVEQVASGSGHDSLTGDDAANVLIGNDGDDTLTGAGGNDTLQGGSGRDSLVGDLGNDRLDGGTSNDTLIGGTGKDTLLGGSARDKLQGDEGSDSLDGGDGHDSLDGGAHADLLKGGNHNDTLLGSGGGDKLFGGNGNDSMDGGTESDWLDGGAGLDTLIGGGGRDTMTGGADADVFRYLAITDSTRDPTGRDLVLDFVHLSDKFDLSAIDAVETLLDDQAFVLDAKGTSSTAVAEGHIGWFTVNKSGTANDRTFLRINTNADGTVEMVIELIGVKALSSADFIL
jgi:Ca2+-binding RTX toxin-like protein